MSEGTPIVVLHDIGDVEGGAAWRDAIARTGWRGEVVAPDLWGHGSAGPPVGGCYEAGDALLQLLPLLRGLDGPPPLVVGVGVNGWAAQVLALGGRASGLVLVDGLGGPWRTAAENIATGRAWLRAISDDPAAVAPAPAGGPDPRVRHGVPPHGSRRLALKAAASMPVPAIIVETPASAMSHEDTCEIVEAFARGAALHRVSSASPDACARAAIAPLVESAPEWCRA